MKYYLVSLVDLMLIYGWIPLGIVGGLILGVSAYRSLTGNYSSKEIGGFNGVVLGIVMIVTAVILLLSYYLGLTVEIERPIEYP